MSAPAHLLGGALLVSMVLVAGCTGSSGSPATTAATRSSTSGAESGCLHPPATCYVPAGTAGYHAGPGWDPVTGWGTPNVQALIPLLAR